MNKILGIFGLLIFVCLFTTVLSDSFVSAYNMFNITRWSALFGILSIGVAFVIITGGIDLSIGSVVGLTACLLPMFIVENGWSPSAAIVTVIAISGLIGLTHGLMITKLKLQPFVVTLCGLLIYRGLARRITEDATQGFGQEFDTGLRLLAIGKPCSWATLMMIGGVCLVLYCLFWLSRDRKNVSEKTTDRRALPWIWLGTGAALALIGSARFWSGIETADGLAWTIWEPYRLRFIETSVPDSAVELPARLLRYAGWLVFVPASLFFLIQGMRDGFHRTRTPLIALVVSAIALAFCVLVLSPLFKDIAKDDLLRVGTLMLSGGVFKAAIMGMVFVSVGAFMGSLAWTLQNVSQVSTAAKTITPIVMISGVCGLIGMTKLPETSVPAPALILFVLAVLAAIFLNRTIYGRYLLALGRNEEAARYSGINTQRMIVLSYVICSLAAGLGGVLFALEVNSVQPSGFGNFYELYAIAAAVLGGCSLRGGEGSVLGVVIGAAVMRVLYNAINNLGISTTLEFAIIGMVILIGAIADVVINDLVVKKTTPAETEALESAESELASSG